MKVFILAKLVNGVKDNLYLSTFRDKQTRKQLNKVLVDELSELKLSKKQYDDLCVDGCSCYIGNGELLTMFEDSVY